MVRAKETDKVKNVNINPKPAEPASQTSKRSSAPQKYEAKAEAVITEVGIEPLSPNAWVQLHLVKG